MWKPIETAPQDGTRILVTRYPHTGKPPYKIAWRHPNNEKRPHWRIGLNKKLYYTPTHWTELPEVSPATIQK